jgi:hypothetical protein
LSFSERSRVFPDGKNPGKDYTGHIPPVKRFFVISYKLMFIRIRRKIIPKAIALRAFTVSMGTTVRVPLTLQSYLF